MQCPCAVILFSLLLHSCRTRDETPLQKVGTRVKSEWSQQQGKEEKGLSLLDQRSSVFDGDEFDVFRRKKDIDLSQVQVGKR